MIKSKITISHRIFRGLWNLNWILLAAWTPVHFHRWRALLVNIFGGQVAYSSYIYPCVKIWDPRNLSMAERSCLGPGVECYNVAKIVIGKYATISQKTYLCSASHDYDQAVVRNNRMDLLIGPIVVEDYAWVAADAFIGPDRVIGFGSVVLARCVVTKDTESMGIYGGNPMKYIRNRESALVDV